jgi:GcrA cell cycle regulator
MRRLVRPWTDQDDEAIKVFVAQGASVMRAAAALRRSKVSIRQRAKKIGCPFPNDRDARKAGMLDQLSHRY